MGGDLVARLNAATGEGRLTLAEFGARAGHAYAAPTSGELARLLRPRIGTMVGSVQVYRV